MPDLLSPIALKTMLVGSLCGVSCALLGCYLVLRRMSLLGDAISHAVLPGIALAFLATGRINGLPIFFGAMALGVLTAVLAESLHRYGNVQEDSSLGVVFTSLFAIGVLLLSRGAANVDLDAGCVLYGLIEFTALDTVDWLGIGIPRAAVTLGAALTLSIAFMGLFWKELKITSFDPALATAMGISAAAMHYMLMAMVAGVTVASFEAVGSILVVAMLIVPGAAAHLLSDRLSWMLVWASLIAVIAAIGGYVSAAWLHTSVSGMMAVTLGVEFAGAVFFAPRHGLVVKWLRNFGWSWRIACEDMVALLFRAEEAERNGDWERAQVAAGEAEKLGERWIGRIARLRLAAKGLIERGKAMGGKAAREKMAGWELTEKGRLVAGSLIRSHRLWETYLERHFDLPLDHFHEPAERMEHFIGPQLQDQLASHLKQPEFDPHGRAIPDADKAENKET